MQLPQDINPTEFDDHYRLQPSLWLDAVCEVFSAHNVAISNLETFKDGSNLLAGNGDLIAKIFPPFHEHQWDSEHRVLKCLWNHDLSIPIPRLIASGKRDDGWPYVIISRLPGVTLESVWPKCSEEKKAEIVCDIGKIMARVHAVPVGGLANLDPPWPQFLKEQRTTFQARHRRLGMPEWFLSEIGDFVDEHFASLPNHVPVILTGEYTPFNLLVSDPSDWRISGMIDFGDAMIGFREYDLLGPLLFLCEGNAKLTSAFFSGYNNTNIGDPHLRKRLLLLAILHRYSNLKFQVRIDGWQSKAKNLAEFEALVFPG